MGARVQPGASVPWLPGPYVPMSLSGCRAPRIGFDEPACASGEDVDLVWRLWLAGWRVRYEPDAQVWHDHRVRLRAFVARRLLYARSVGMLAQRHPAALPATRVSGWMALPWALALAGHRRAALGVATAEAVLIDRKLRPVTGRPNWLAGALVARGLLATGLGLAQAARRAWAPPLCVLALRRRSVGGVLLAAFAAPVVQDALTTREPRAALGDAAIRLLDETIALAGTWEGCFEQRTIRPLLPAWACYRW